MALRMQIRPWFQVRCPGIAASDHTNGLVRARFSQLDSMMLVLPFGEEDFGTKRQVALGGPSDNAARTE